MKEVIALLFLSALVSGINSTVNLNSTPANQYFLSALDCVSFQQNASSFTVCALNQTITQTITQFVNVSVPQIVFVNQSVEVEKNVTKRFNEFHSLKLGERFFDYDANLTIEAQPKLFLEKILNPGDFFNLPDYGLSLFVQNATLRDCITIVQNNSEASKAVCPLPPGPNEEACKILFPNLTASNASCNSFAPITQFDKQEIAKLSVDGMWSGLFWASAVVLAVISLGLFFRGRFLRLLLGQEEK